MQQFDVAMRLLLITVFVLGYSQSAFQHSIRFFFIRILRLFFIRLKSLIYTEMKFYFRDIKPEYDSEISEDLAFLGQLEVPEESFSDIKSEIEGNFLKRLKRNIISNVNSKKNINITIPSNRVSIADLINREEIKDGKSCRLGFGDRPPIPDEFEKLRKIDNELKELNKMGAPRQSRKQQNTRSSIIELLINIFSSFSLKKTKSKSLEPDSTNE